MVEFTQATANGEDRTPLVMTMSVMQMTNSDSVVFFLSFHFFILFCYLSFGSLTLIAVDLLQLFCFPPLLLLLPARTRTFQCCLIVCSSTVSFSFAALRCVL